MFWVDMSIYKVIKIKKKCILSELKEDPFLLLLSEQSWWVCNQLFCTNNNQFTSTRIHCPPKCKLTFFSFSLFLLENPFFFLEKKNHHANWNWHELKIFPRALGGHDTRLYMNRFFWDLSVVLIFCV